MPLMVPNNGAIPQLRDDDIIEITCEIEKEFVVLEKLKTSPELQMHFIRTIKRFERLTVEAIREKSRKKAIEALTYRSARQLLSHCCTTG